MKSILSKLVVQTSFILVIIFAACQPKEQVDYAIVKGSISNTSSAYITIKNDNFSYDIDLDINGEFLDTIQVTRGTYKLYSGRERTSIFLDQGYDLTITIDQELFDETLTFGLDESAGNKINNYLANKVRTEEEIMIDFTTTFSLEETAFLSTIDRLNEAHFKSLNQSNLDDPQFVENEKRDLKYDRLGNLINYKSYHIYLTKERSFDTSPEFKKEAAFDFSNEDDFKNIASYRSLVGSLFGHMIEEGEVKAAFELIRSIESNHIKAKLAPMFKREVRPGNSQAEDIFKGIKSISSDSSLIAELGTKMEVISKLQIGMPSPTFNYDNVKGGTTSLTDLKGKYIYVDIWATWCGPCIREIPALKELEQSLHEENITFLSISIDKEEDREKWIQMIDKKSLSGIQLFADQDWKSNFIKSYLIESIPRFLIIDPEGNIVDPDADRPSDPELRIKLDGLLSS